jgi:hypothetical protein
MIYSEVYVPSCSLWGRELGQQVHMPWCLVRIFEGQPRTQAIRGRNVAWLHLAGGGFRLSSPPPPDLVVHVRAPLFACVIARYWWRATRWPHLVHGGLASPPSIDWVAHARYSGRPKYSAHLPKEGHILGGMFPHTDMLESSGFFSLKDLCLGNNIELKTFKYL